MMIKGVAMKKILIFALLFSPAAQALNCKEAITTLDIDECAKIEQEKVEAELNSVYQKIMKELSVPDTEYEKPSEVKSALLKAQRAWVTFREADCNAVYTQYQDGTIRNVMYISCMQARAEQRIKELKQFNEGAEAVQ